MTKTTIAGKHGAATNKTKDRRDGQIENIMRTTGNGHNAPRGCQATRSDSESLQQRLVSYFAWRRRRSSFCLRSVITASRTGFLHVQLRLTVRNHRKEVIAFVALDEPRRYITA